MTALTSSSRRGGLIGYLSRLARDKVWDWSARSARRPFLISSSCTFSPFHWFHPVSRAAQFELFTHSICDASFSTGNATVTRRTADAGCWLAEAQQAEGLVEVPLPPHPRQYFCTRRLSDDGDAFEDLTHISTRDAAVQRSKFTGSCQPRIRYTTAETLIPQCIWFVHFFF